MLRKRNGPDGTDNRHSGCTDFERQLEISGTLNEVKRARWDLNP